MASRPTPIRPGRFLPRDPRVDAPYRLTPQLVFRIGILGFLTLAVFAILFFRLWALQVLSGNQYLVAAQNNQLRVDADRCAARADRGSLRPRARRQHERHGGQDLARRPAQARRSTPSSAAWRGSSQVPLADVTREIKKHRGDPVTPVTVRDAVNENEVHYLLRAPVGVPGHDDHEHVRPELPVRRLSPRTSSATSARSRRTS